MSVRVDIDPGAFASDVARQLHSWTEDEFPARIWAKDATLWTVRPPEPIEQRLGWLDLPEQSVYLAPKLESFAAGLIESTDTIVVLGMGGSSLTPGVFQGVLGNGADHPPLRVLDSTHPGAIRSTDDAIDVRRTLFVISSKSGTTVETLSLFRHYWALARERLAEPGQRFVAVTDPGSPLEGLALEREFRRVFLAPADVGGRYSALTEVGLVPAAGIGVDIRALSRAATEAARTCGPDVDPTANPGLLLGAFLGICAAEGSDKATFLTSERLRPLVRWIEQLVAESTGKAGTGIVPVGGDEDAPVLGTDRCTVAIVCEDEDDPLPRTASGRPMARIVLDDHHDLAGVMFVLEMAIAAAGSVLGVQPFDQPDVELAKTLARRAMADGDVAENQPELSAATTNLPERIGDWLHGATPPDYAGIHLYLPPTRATEAASETIRRRLRDALGIAVTTDFGPQLLHATGQMHKGGPPTGRFLQIVDEPDTDIAIPETDFTFGRLTRVQAIGDYRALAKRGRSVLRISLGTHAGDGLAAVLRAVETATALPI